MDNTQGVVIQCNRVLSHRKKEKRKGQGCNRYGRTDEKLTGKQIKKASFFIVKTLALKGIK